MRIYIGIDLGTSSVKVTALDEMRQVVGQAMVTYPTLVPEPGWAEQDPADWTRATCAALTRLIASLPSPAEPRAVAFTGQLPTLVVADGTGQARHPAIVWYDDRAADDAAALLDATAHAAWYARSGIVLDAHYLAPMYKWLQRNRAGVLSAPHRLCSAKDALFQAFTGEWCTDPSTASGYGIFNPISGEWDPELCAASGVDRALLPSVLPADQVAGALRVAGIPQALAGVPAVVGAGDALTGALGCGGSAEGTLAAITGTSTSLVISAGVPILDPRCRFLLTPHALPRLWALEMDLMATGSSLRWLAGVLRLAHGALLEHAAAAPAGSHGVVAFPYLAGGEQGALWNPKAPAAFLGMTLATTSADLARALLEGIAFETRRCVELWQGQGIAVRDVVLAGGLAEPVFASIIAAVLDLPVRAAADGGASSAGAALLAGIGVGAWSREEALQGPAGHATQPFTPESTVASRYKSLYDRYIGLSNAACASLDLR